MSIKYNVANVIDLGSYYRARSVAKSDMAYIEPGRLYLKLSALCAEKIKAELEKGTEVLIPKDLEREVLPMDLVLNETDPLTVIKGMALARMGSKIDGHLASVSALEFYNFFTIHAKLMDAGYIITDENREEKYLEIINSGSNEIISALEEYLEARDNINIVSWAYKQLKRARETMEDVKNEEEVKKIETSFFEAIENPQ